MEETKDLIRHAASVGADGAAVLTPFYFSYSQESLFNYYSELLEMERELPIYAYNIPSLTHNAIDVGAMKQLAERYPNFVGVKDSSGDASRILDYVYQMPKGFRVIVGSDSLFLSLLLSGVHGCVSGPGSVIPEAFVKVYSEFTSGEIAQAQESQKRLASLSQVLEGGGNLDLLKKVLNWRGFPVGAVRPPMARVSLELERNKREQFEALWAEAGYSL
jgi:4-hydroxy-tetrahydrodipicolinate synthase